MGYVFLLGMLPLPTSGKLYWNVDTRSICNGERVQYDIAFRRYTGTIKE